MALLRTAYSRRRAWALYGVPGPPNQLKSNPYATGPGYPLLRPPQCHFWICARNQHNRCRESHMLHRVLLVLPVLLADERVGFGNIRAAKIGGIPLDALARANGQVAEQDHFG